MVRRLRSALIYAAYCVAVCGGCLLLAEAGLRLATDRPLGLFDATPLNHSSLYHPNSRIPMELMAVPYLIETNSLGFRGPEVSLEKPPGVTRIIALGDSITDGYLVDNPDTYPVRLAAFLQQEDEAVEVINAARGGSTINREFWILRHHGERLRPDVVVLTFVGNDIYEMGSRSADALAGYSPEPLAFANNAALWAARTALGEWMLDAYFDLRFEGYRGGDIEAVGNAVSNRYDIPGGSDYDAILPEALGSLQAYKLHLPELSEALRERADVYLNVLERVRDWCRERNIRFVWVWHPTFVQIYDDSPSEPVYEYLLPRVEALGIPVIDATPAFRAFGRAEPLTCAPVDYHLNPTGYDLLAKTIGRGLLGHGILEPIDKEVE